MTSTITKPNLGFDPDALRAKYREERDKRLNQGDRHVVDMSGEFQEFADDPYVEPGFTRAPITEEVDVVVVGGGMGGLTAAAKLRQLGVKDLRVIEQAGDFGGTWYWNRYPGIRCDIEAYIYIPLLEEVGTMPTEKYAEGKEILAHCQAAGRKFDLYDSALFQTKVESITWDETSSRWIIRTDRQDAIRARYVIVGSGPLHRPKLPAIPGIKSFKDRIFHSSRWDYDYTGGNSSGGMDRLGDQKVGVIGTGATAIQIVPHLAQSAGSLYVFQRTPSAVDERNNRKTDPDWYRSLPAGWQQERKDNFLSIMLGIPQAHDLVNDRWTDVWGKLAKWGEDEGSIIEAADQAEVMQTLDYQKMQELRARVETVVTDPKTAEALKPWYNLFCKRPLYSDDYLQAFNNPNVTLVDTQGRGVEKIDETGVWVKGEHIALDAIIFATGFQVGAYTHEAGGYVLTGRNGLTLKDKWAGGVRSLFGIQAHGFPNFFIIGSLTQASVAVNYPHIATEQAAHAAEMIATCLNAGIATIEITQAAEDGWCRVCAEKAVDTAISDAECTPGYFNNEGNADDRPSLFAGLYGGGPFEYFQLCEAWRRGGYETEADITYLNT